jgi:hypothetical protein
MTKEIFSSILQNFIVKDIENKRKMIEEEERQEEEKRKLGKEKTSDSGSSQTKVERKKTNRALIIMDGASSHANYGDASFLASQDVDVCVLPAHTSHLLQPLDLAVNAIFKQALAEKKIIFPNKKEQKDKLLNFLDDVEDAMEKALLRPNVKAGWKKAYMVRKPAPDLLPLLTPAPEGFRKRENRRFSISGTFVTDTDFLLKWSLHEAKRVDREKKRLERISQKQKSESIPEIEEEKKKHCGRALSSAEGDSIVQDEKDERERLAEQDPESPKRGHGRPKKQKLFKNRRKEKPWTESDSEEVIGSETDPDQDQDCWQIPMKEEEDCRMLTVEEIKLLREKRYNLMMKGKEEGSDDEEKSTNEVYSYFRPRKLGERESEDESETETEHESGIDGEDGELSEEEVERMKVVKRT